MWSSLARHSHQIWYSKICTTVSFMFFLTYISLTNSLKYISMYIFVMKYLLKFCVLFVTWINHYLVDLKEFFQLSSVQSVSCIQICNHMNCSIPGFPVHHQLPGLTQTHDLPVGDDIQPSYPLSSPSLAFNLSQHQGLFQWVGSLPKVAKVLEFQLQHQSFQWIFKTDFL